MNLVGIPQVYMSIYKWTTCRRRMDVVFEIGDCLCLYRTCVWFLVYRHVPMDIFIWSSLRGQVLMDMDANPNCV